jgi:hypothetical protein
VREKGCSAKAAEVEAGQRPVPPGTTPAQCAFSLHSQSLGRWAENLSRHTPARGSTPYSITRPVLSADNTRAVLFTPAAVNAASMAVATTSALTRGATHNTVEPLPLNHPV